MAVWREPTPPWSYSIGDEGVRAMVTPTDGPEAPATIEYLRHVPAEPTRRHWRATPENAVVLDVRGAQRAPSLEEGKRLARETLARLVSGEVVGEERPFAAKPKPTVVAELDHPTKMLRAVVLRWPDAYEVRTVGYVPDGYTLPVSTPSISQDLGFEWGRLDLLERLLADTEVEAMKAARAEFERLAVEDLPVRDRPRTPEG